MDMDKVCQAVETEGQFSLIGAFKGTAEHLICLRLSFSIVLGALQEFLLSFKGK